MTIGPPQLTGIAQAILIYLLTLWSHPSAVVGSEYTGSKSVYTVHDSIPLSFGAGRKVLTGLASNDSMRGGKVSVSGLIGSIFIPTNRGYSVFALGCVMEAVSSSSIGRSWLIIFCGKKFGWSFRGVVSFTRDCAVVVVREFDSDSIPANGILTNRIPNQQKPHPWNLYL